MDILTDYQSRLFPFAYNILGSADDAKDAVQDVITKFLSIPEKNIDNEIGYLVKGVVNQSINIKNSKRKKTTTTGWLPEPVATDYADANINKEEIISYSMLVLLEKLNAKERAVFILKEAFDYSHEEIADTLSMSVENSRKLLSRAKTTLRSGDNEMVTTGSASPSLQRYIELIKTGDLASLEKMLTNDILVMTDGGKIKILSPFITGIKAASQHMNTVYSTYQKNLSVVPGTINHQPALLFYNGDNLVNCQVFEFNKDSELINRIYSIVDPEKLKNIGKK